MEVRAEVEWFAYIAIRREKMKTISASNGVRKVGPREGRTIQIGNARLTWKVTGEDTGYTTALYEMELVGHDFYLFADADSGQPSVVYRRKGFDYGVIRLA